MKTESIIKKHTHQQQQVLVGVSSGLDQITPKQSGPQFLTKEALSTTLSNLTPHYYGHTSPYR